jgi:putative nucleotidyltransferase with HDIG domain
VRLGLRRLRSVLYELAARTVFDSPRQRIRDAFRGLWDHSVTVAGLARRVNLELGSPCDGDEVHLAGLLHDAGKPVVGSLLLEAEKVLAREGRWLDDQAWLDVIGSSHRVVGCALADKWQMAPEVKRVIVGCDKYGEGAEAKATNIVCFANAVAKQAGKSVGPVDRDANDDLVAQGAETLGLDWRFVHTLIQHVSELERLYAPPPPGK